MSMSVVIQVVEDIKVGAGELRHWDTSGGDQMHDVIFFYVKEVQCEGKPTLGRPAQNESL